MATLSPPVHDALREAHRALAARYGGRLVRAVLFGSHARGDAREDSDVDVLVVLGDPVDAVREIDQLVDLELDILDRYGLVIHLIPFSAARYQDRTHPLMMHVHHEGVELREAA